MGIQIRPCVIMCAGEIEDYDYIGALIAENAYIIAADGGYDRLVKMNKRPDILIGDFDSVSDFSNLPSNTLKYPVEKDETDTLLCVNKAIELGYRDVLLLGATGGRLDHTFANLSLLLYMNQNGVCGRIADETHLSYVLGAGKHEITAQENHYVSFFAFGCDRACVTLSGFQYNVSKLELSPGFPIGISNEITGKTGVITVHTGNILSIISKK